ncbi:O-antigen ligase family protein [Acidaminobacter hydrogenoformans]|uniref:O-Antigen ligase n=1 Tax=Acidaminobacter hydrogenoformans DSM 2784 TaxID=1120920 RepID=A0A1G5RYB0_9FIRM|nr:O-antigen ligase family protein [Acidaminobacter hydrogenoformans]SCZ79043.1 O-Antigen ligase [Acidaminobacter hydrogenoformans DSM 2784]
MKKAHSKNPSAKTKNKIKTSRTPRTPGASKGIMIALFLILAIIPIIVRLKVVDLTAYAESPWVSDVDYDFFSYYKSRILISITFLMTAVFVFDRSSHGNPHEKKPLDLSILVFMVTVLFSAVLSEFVSLSFWGFRGRYEGALVLWSYMLILFIGSKYTYDEKQLKLLLKGLYFSVAVVGTIGIFQFFKMDLFKTEIGKTLIVPMQYLKSGAEITIRMAETQIYSTLQNSNYMGSFIALLAPLLLTLVFFIHDLRHKLLVTALFALSMANLFGSRSRAGIIGVSVAAVVMLIMFRRELFKRWKVTLVVVVIIAGVVTSMNTALEGLIYKRILATINSLAPAENLYGAQQATSEDNVLRLELQEDPLFIKFDNDQLYFMDAEDTVLEAVKGEKEYTLNDPRFSNFKFDITMATEEMPMVTVRYHRVTLKYLFLEDEVRYVNHADVAVKINPIEKWGFVGQERLGSSRGYIWSRTIPMLRDTLLIGHGPDTYMLYFPQDDYIGKQIAYSTTGMVTDKPHNMYLHTAVNTGVLSLLAQLVIFGLYIAQSMKLYFKNSYEDFRAQLGVGIFLGVVGYLGAGLFNDAIVSIAPVFWALLGIGFSLNQSLLKERKEALSA